MRWSDTDYGHRGGPNDLLGPSKRTLQRFKPRRFISGIRLDGSNTIGRLACSAGLASLEGTAVVKYTSVQ